MWRVEGSDSHACLLLEANAAVINARGSVKVLWEQEGVGINVSCSSGLIFPCLETTAPSFLAINVESFENVEVFSKDWEGFRVVLLGDRGMVVMTFLQFQFNHCLLI